MSDPKESGLSENSISAIAYFTLLPAILFLAIAPYNKRLYVRFHAWQSIVFSVFAVIVGYALAFILPFTMFLWPLVSSVLWMLDLIIWVAIFIVWLWCVINALNGKSYKLPIIGNWAEKQASR